MSIERGITVAFERLHAAQSAAAVQTAHAYVVGYLAALRDAGLIDLLQDARERDRAATVANQRMAALRLGRAAA